MCRCLGSFLLAGFLALVEFGIADAGVVDGFELLDKGSLDGLDIAEAERGVAQQAVGNL